MLPEEKQNLLLFFSLVLAVYVFAFGALIRLLLDYFKFVEISKTPFSIWFRRIIFSLAVVGFGCFGYGHFIEPYWVEVRKVEIKSAKIPKNVDRIRLVHISDIHSDPQPRLEERLPKIIAEQNPDAIFFSGDSTNSEAGVPVFKKCLTELAKIAPTFAVKGNWDLTTQALFEETGATQLKGNLENPVIKGVKLNITGLTVFSAIPIKDVFSNAPKENFTIFLYHYPDEIKEVAEQKADLYLAGHTHGGQVALPFYGAMVTLSKYGKRFEAGTYRIDETWLNVNRGIGMEGGNAPRVRFFSRPEVTVIDILPE